MRSYLAILKDSFREAMASRVLLVTLIGIGVVLALLAPFGLGTTVATELRRSELLRPERLLKQLTEGRNETGSAVAHLWSLMSEEQVERIEELQDPENDQGSRRRPGRPNPQKRRLVDTLNELLTKSDFFDAEVWADTELNDEAEELVGRTDLTETEELRRNLLLLASEFSSSIELADSRAVSLTYGTGVVQGPIPLTPDQVEVVFEQVLVAVVAVFLGFFGVFGCLLVTAGLIPRTFEAGEISLLLSKPVSRSLLFVVKFLGGCVFTLLYSTVLVVGIWVLLGIRMGFWRGELLWCIPVYVFLFMIYYAVSAVAGAIWRNSIVALSLVVVFWLFVTVIGTSQQALHENLIEERGIREIVQAGPDLVTVDGEQEVYVWDDGSSTWREVFKEPPGGAGALVRFLMGSSARLAPVYDVQGDRILALQQNQSRFGGRGSSVLVSGSADDDWERNELAQLPDFVPAVLLSRSGRIILPAQGAVYEYVGQSDQARQQAGFLSSITGGLLGRTKNGLKELQPDDWPDLGEEFAAALDPVNENLLVYGERHLHVLQAQEDGTYGLTQSHDVESDQPGLLAVAGKFLVLALQDGRVQVRSVESLETVREFQLEDRVRPRYCVAADDGSHLAVQADDDSVLLFDAASQELDYWQSPGDDVVSAVSLGQDGQLLVGDGRLAVHEYSLSSEATEHRKSWSEPTTWVYQLYDYAIVPAWTLLPKPAQLNEFVAYVLTRDDEKKRRGFGGIRNRNDLAEEVRTFDPQPVLRDNAIFVLVMLAFGCVYISRRDF